MRGDLDGAKTDADNPENSGRTRREVVRQGIRLAFIAPVISTFFARDAYADNYSCYQQGQVCNNDNSDPEPCCAGLTCNGLPGTCEP